MKQVVMCRPDYYDITYELSTNRWMDKDNPPNKDLAILQWQRLLNNYRIHGINPYIMPGQPNLSDMTFAANAGLPVGKYFIVSKFFHQERELEVAFIKEYFDKTHEVVDINSEFTNWTFEGQGDALWFNHKSIMVGYSVRTGRKGLRYLQRALSRIDDQLTIIPLRMRSLNDYKDDEKVFYHLDTCLLYMEKINTFIINPRAFEDNALRSLNNLGNVIILSREEAETFACNSVIISDDVIFTPILKHDRVKKIFDNLGYKIVENDMSEFMKSGGAVKCLTLELYQEKEKKVKQ